MSTLIDDKDFSGIEGGNSDPDSQDCLKDPAILLLMRPDSNGANLDAVRESMLRSLSASPSDFLKDRILLDLLPLARKLLTESFVETENMLVRDSPSLVTIEDTRSKFNHWQSCLEPWHRLLKNLKNLGAVSCESMENLLDSLPDVIKVVFNHCKRSETLYGQKFAILMPQLTSLFRQANVVLNIFLSILETSVDFDVEGSQPTKSLETVLNKIGDIASLTNGTDLKTLLGTWKTFAKIAATQESLVKKLGLEKLVTRRYPDMVKDIETLLSEKKDANCDRRIKCAALLLKILGRLCEVYRGDCGNEVFIILVQLLTNLYRYSPPFPSERFIPPHSKITEYSEKHIVPVTDELLNTLLDDNDFPTAFFQFGKTEVKEAICYHLLTLRIMEKLIRRKSDFSIWLGNEHNIVDIALGNMNHCCEILLMGKLKISINLDLIPDKFGGTGIYEATLRIICHFIAGVSTDDLPSVERALLKHLLSGEFWSSLLSCDSWTFLGRISPPELCHEHLSYLIKVQKLLVTREKSLEFEIISNLIARLYELLPEGMQESLSREIDVHSNRRFVEPFRKLLPHRARKYFLQQSSFDAADDLGKIFQDLRRSPSMKNWIRLTSFFTIIGTVALPKDERFCTNVLRNIWNFVASRLPKSDGKTREVLLELVVLLLDCGKLNDSDNLANDRLVASIYKSMFETLADLLVDHRIRMNFYLRENLENFDSRNKKETLSSLTELFCCLLNDDNPWARQETFETYAEHILKCPDPELFGTLSMGISNLPRLLRQMRLYFANQRIYDFTHHASLENYLCKLAATSRESAMWHKCYEPDFPCQNEKRPRLETEGIDKRVDNVCNEINRIVDRKNELNDSSLDKLRAVLLRLLDPSG